MLHAYENWPMRNQSWILMNQNESHDFLHFLKSDKTKWSHMKVYYL
jgi:hypothetical protein